jgi:hypothetical protein
MIRLLIRCQFMRSHEAKSFTLLRDAEFEYQVGRLLLQWKVEAQTVGSDSARGHRVPVHSFGKACRCGQHNISQKHVAVKEHFIAYCG